MLNRTTTIYKKKNLKADNLHSDANAKHSMQFTEYLDDHTRYNAICTDAHLGILHTNTFKAD